MNRRLLILAATFPPHPSPATHRARFLARYGKGFGWDVEVLTVRPECYEEQLDWELHRLVPADLVVHRAGAWPARWTRRFGIGEIAIRSYVPMRRAVLRLVREHRPDLIFIPGPPFHTVAIATEARRRFGVPYVPDFTDPWVLPLPPGKDRWTRKAFWAHRLAAAIEPPVVRGAAHILAVSDGTNDILRARYPDVPPERFSALPFGFEPSDFDALRATPRPHPHWDRHDGALHLAYVGAMLPDGYETVRALFAAIHALRRRDPALAARLRLHFFGTTYDPSATRGLVEPVAREMGLGDVVTEHPRRIPYVDALNVLTSADVVLALGSTQHHYTASKIFPCILARRPLLAVYHERSTVCEIVRQSGGGELVTYNDDRRAESRAEEIADALRRLDASRSSTRVALDPAVLREYSAEHISGRLFGIFDEIVGPAVRPAPRVPAHA